MNVSEAAMMEYLKKSLDEKLRYIIHGAKDRKEVWSRLDKHFADKVGAVRSMLRNLVRLDLSKGKL